MGEASWRLRARRDLRLAGIGVLLTAVGSSLAFLTDGSPDTPWSLLAIALVLSGFGIAGFCIDRGRREILTELRERDREAAERRAARKRASQSN
jgi:hypothetical protein